MYETLKPARSNDMFTVPKPTPQFKIACQLDLGEVGRLDELAAIVQGTRSDVIRHLILEGLTKHLDSRPSRIMDVVHDDEPIECTCFNCPRHR